MLLRDSTVECLTCACPEGFHTQEPVLVAGNIQADSTASSQPDVRRLYDCNRTFL